MSTVTKKKGRQADPNSKSNLEKAAKLKAIQDQVKAEVAANEPDDDILARFIDLTGKLLEDKKETQKKLQRNKDILWSQIEEGVGSRTQVEWVMINTPRKQSSNDEEQSENGAGGEGGSV